MRIDQLLVEQGLAATRSQAQRLVAAGVRWRLSSSQAWQTARKNGDDLPMHVQLELIDPQETRFVSRGGLKLEGALALSGVSPQGKHCLDVGQSTGGFTDCLLQYGALQVVGVDVGHGQIHPKLAHHPQVRVIEGVNARSITPAQLQNQQAMPAQGFELIVGDVSFISLTLVLPALVPLLSAQGDLLLLVKPQFELQPENLSKGGLVKDPTLYDNVEQRLRHCAAALSLQVIHWLPSPITGGDGNREFFIHARKIIP